MKNFYKEPALKKYLSKSDNPNIHLHGINDYHFVSFAMLRAVQEKVTG